MTSLNAINYFFSDLVRKSFVIHDHSSFLSFYFELTKKFTKKLENNLPCLRHQSILINFEAKVEN